MEAWRTLRYFSQTCMIDANCLHSVSTWALEEARRRLEAEGILPDPEASENKK